MPTLVVVRNPEQWPFKIPGVEVVDSRTYLTSPAYGELRGVKVFNLSRSYKYQSAGYYVTLLAAARGHRPLPSISTIQDLHSRSMVRVVSEELEELIQKSLQTIQSERFTLSIYFGRNLAKRYDRLSQHLFNLFQAPLLRAQFARNDKWLLRSVTPISMGEVPDSHHDFLLQVATQYFSGRRARVRRRAAMKYDLAILVNPAEKLPPSDDKAIQRFVKASEQMGMRAEIIGPEDYGQLAEFDALFLRETTAVDHHTYRFARRAAFEGLVVIDDPESIVKCSNKVFLAELMSRYDVPMPRTLILHKDNRAEAIGLLGLPCVLKKPDSSFSKGVIKAETAEDFDEHLDALLEESDLVIAQEFLPTDFDWRIGILDRQALYACKYYMARRHWQIYQHEQDGQFRGGRWETLPVEIAPRKVVRTALRAANLVGDGFYGVDVKELDGQPYVIEVNDNPSVDSGVEDAILRDELYRRVMSSILRRIEASRAGAAVSG